MKKWKLCLLGLLVCVTMSGCEKQKNIMNDEIVNQEPVDAQTRIDVIEDVLKINIDAYVDSNTITAKFMNEITYSNPNTLEEGFSYIKKEKIDGNYLAYFNSNVFSQIISFYELEEDEKIPYAFTVSVGGYENGKPLDYPVKKSHESKAEFKVREYQYVHQMIIDALKGTDLYVMEDYPYSYGYEFDENQEAYKEMYEYVQDCFCYSPACVVIGSIEDLKDLCEFGRSVNGLYLHLTSALRPDIVEKLIEKGYTAENIGDGLWRPENYQQNFGEEECVEMSVKVKHWR